MNQQRILSLAAYFFLGLCLLSLLSLSAQSLLNPQATMDLADVQLTNTDAISSIRGIYGGVGLVLALTTGYLLFRDIPKGLLFMALFWGSYVLARVMTILIDGPLGEFGSFWIVIETSFFVLSLVLYLLYIRRSSRIASR